MAVNDVYRVKDQFRLDDKVWACLFDYKDIAGQPNESAAEDLATAFDSAVSQLVRDCVSADATNEALYVRGQAPIGKQPHIIPYASTPGDRAADALPANSCVVFTKRAGEPPVSGTNGRIYLSGISKGDVTAGNMSAAWISGPATALEDQMSEILTGSGGDWQPVVLAYFQAGIPQDPPLRFDINSAGCKPIIYTQRPRTTTQRGIAPP